MQIRRLVKKFIPHFLLDFYHYLLAFFGVVIFWFPSKNLIVIGVTGTSGKTTTVDFITRILEEAGNKVASMSSVRFKIGEQEQKNQLKMTMPGRFKVQKFLRQAVHAKCNYAVLEVTSEGIKQFRHKFINFNTVVFTNLTPEHIESHGGFENYRNEKLKLFKVVKNMHIVNLDDENSKYFLEISAKQKYFFGINDYLIKNGRSLLDREDEDNKEVKVMARGINLKNGVTSFSINSAKVNNLTNFTTERFIRLLEINLHLLGEFNVYNALAAISVGISQGVPLEICKKALEKISSIPGRMEVVVKNPLVIVDYAHTPEQLEQVYKSLSGNPLICVLGSCGGGRDKWKRPKLGKIAKQYCKEIIITNEDPYDENPLEIINQVAQGAGNDVIKILDRREAIKRALKLAKPGDVVIITGKGSEPWMCVENGRKIPWDDRKIIREELEIN